MRLCLSQLILLWKSFWAVYCCILFARSVALVPRIEDLGVILLPDMVIALNLQLPAAWDVA